MAFASRTVASRRSDTETMLPRAMEFSPSVWNSPPMGEAFWRPVFALMAVATLALLAGMAIVTNERMAAAEGPAPEDRP